VHNPMRYVRACAWGGPILLVVTIIFWGLLGRNIPPYSAGLSAVEFKEQFAPVAVQIRLGMTTTIAFSVLYFVWGLAISKVMEEVEHHNNILSTAQLWGAGFTTIIFVIPCGIWLTATFRADTLEPSTLQILFDLGWMIFDLAYSLTTLQMVALGICFLSDKRKTPLFPAWVSWFSIWVGVMFVLEALNPFFKTGPFSRSGLLNYWIEFSIFFLFMAIVSAYLLKAITVLEREYADKAIRAD
jgi:hypothetical protein